MGNVAIGEVAEVKLEGSDVIQFDSTTSSFLMNINSYCIDSATASGSNGPEFDPTTSSYLRNIDSFCQSAILGTTQALEALECEASGGMEACSAEWFRSKLDIHHIEKSELFEVSNAVFKPKFDGQQAQNVNNGIANVLDMPIEVLGSYGQVPTLSDARGSFADVKSGILQKKLCFYA